MERTIIFFGTTVYDSTTITLLDPNPDMVDVERQMMKYFPSLRASKIKYLEVSSPEQAKLIIDLLDTTKGHDTSDLEDDFIKAITRNWESLTDLD